MPKNVQIRDIDDDVYAGLVRRAAEEGITVPELLRREAGRPSVTQWLSRIGRRIHDWLAALVPQLASR
jgi:antitoxin FitA